MSALPCSLCGSLSSGGIFSKDKVFCCPGCLTVYSILEARGEALEKENPLFQEALKSGVISNPNLLEEIQEKKIPSLDLQKLYLEIKDMWCSACALGISYLLLRKKGVYSALVDYATDIGKIEFDPCLISKEEILRLINKMGYQPALLESDEKKGRSTSLNKRFGVAAFCSLNIMMMAYPIYISHFEKIKGDHDLLFAWISFFLSLPIVTFSAIPIYKKALIAAKVKRFGMESLATIAILASFFLSSYELFKGSSEVYFDSLAVIVTLILGGKIIEGKAKFSAKDSLLRLLKAKPKRARKKIEDGVFEFRPIKEIKIGDSLLVHSGEKIVLDGKVIEGEGSIDESLMTGEPFPVFKSKDAKVVGGTFLQNGSLTYQVEALEEESTLQKIIQMIEEGLGKKTSYERAVEPILKWFVPALLLFIMAIAAIEFLFFNLSSHDILLRVLAILLISCPCAIGIAAPFVESKLLESLSKEGIIIKNRAALRVLAEPLFFIFDKTGTLTEGKFLVLDGLEKFSQKEKTQLKSLTSKSIHPISRAIFKELSQELCAVNALFEHPGMGIEGEIMNEKIVLGSKKFLDAIGISFGEDFQPRSKTFTTTVYASFSHGKAMPILLGDKIKKEASELIKNLGSENTFLLSGDREESVQAVANSLKMPKWLSECHPLSKKEFVEKLKREGKTICMIGDGINDAPALTASNVSISVVSASDITAQSADVLLTQDSLKKIEVLFALSKKGKKLIRQNLFWAFFYNVIGIGLAGFGLLTPLYSAFAMTLSSIFVTLNARRMG